MLEKVFGFCDVSKSPNMDFFGHFKDFLPCVNQALFTTAMEDDSMAAMIASWKDNVIEFVTAKLEKISHETTTVFCSNCPFIFLDGGPACGICFRYPGAIHRARWMTMAIYSTELWLFRNQQEPPQPGSSGSRKSRDRGPSYIRMPKIWSPMKEAALFVTAIYTKYRFESPVSTAAPRNDLVHISEKGSYEGSHHGIQSTFVVFIRTVGRIRVI